MAWNESGNGKSRWGEGEQPGDLDKIVKGWQRKLGGLFGGGRSGQSGQSGSAGGGAGGVALVALAVIAWLASGLYRVDEAEQGIVLRFGKFAEATPPGLRWHLPYPIESVERVNTRVVNRFEQRSQMLTADENFVVLDMAVQYRKSDPAKYLFKVREPEETVSEVSESAIREVVGKSRLDNILVEDQAGIARRTRELIQATLDSYESGIDVLSVNLQDVEFPEEVREAVQDVVEAREDRQRLVLAAESYRNDLVPRARGDAARMIEAAEAYRERVIADAEGEATRFEALLAEYLEAPRVTRERLYIEAMEEVLANSNKVLLDAEGSGNLLYLPIDKLISGQEERAARGGAGAGTGQGSASSMIVEGSASRARDNPRSRRTRP